MSFGTMLGLYNLVGQWSVYCASMTQCALAMSSDNSACFYRTTTCGYSFRHGLAHYAAALSSRSTLLACSPQLCVVRVPVNMNCSNCVVMLNLYVVCGGCGEGIISRAVVDFFSFEKGVFIGIKFERWGIF